VTPIQYAIKRVTEDGEGILPAREIETPPPTIPRPKPERQIKALVTGARKDDAESAALRSTLTSTDFPPLPLARVKQLADPTRNGPIVVSLALEVEFSRARIESLSLQLADELVFRQRAQGLIAQGVSGEAPQ
jgi:hypothetical protein